MAKKRVGTIVFSVCLIAFVSGIITGYLRNNNTEKIESLPTDNVQAVLGEEETVPFTLKKKTEYYQIKSKENYVMLYEVFNDNSKEELQRCEVDKTFLPETESKILEEGLDFYDREEALMVMESFIS